MQELEKSPNLMGTSSGQRQKTQTFVERRLKEAATEHAAWH